MEESDLGSGKPTMDVGFLKNGENKRNQKLRITIHLDRDIISYFKNRAAEAAKGYQTLINDALREYTGLGSQNSVITDLVERVKRLEEELFRKPFD